MAEPEPSAPGRTPRLSAIALLLAGGVLLSRVLGVLRESLLAYQVGAGAEVDAYRAAFLLPDILNYFLAGGALSIAFIPFYTRLRSTAGEAAAARFYGLVLGTTGAAVVVATVALWVFADALVALQFPEFSEETRALTTRLTRIVLPAQIFFVIGGVIRGALMAHGRFQSQALAGPVYNLGIIAAGAGLGARLGAEAFAWGALLGAFLGPFALALFEARRVPEMRARPHVGLRDPAFLQYLAGAAPLMLGVSLLTVDEWYDKWFGGLLAAGTVAALGYARQVMLMPVATVGQAIATAALPTLARLHADGQHETLNRTLLDTLRAGLALALLAGVGLYVFAAPVVEVLFQRGAFGPQDAERVTALLRIFAFAVPAWIVQQIAVRAFYARGDMWRPMLLSSGLSVVAAGLYYALGARLGAEGLALAGALGMTVSALATLALARHCHQAPPWTPLFDTLARAAAIAAVAGAAAAWLTARLVPGGSAWALLAVGGVLYGGLVLAGAQLVGDAPTRAALDRLLRRLRVRRAT